MVCGLDFVNPLHLQLMNLIPMSPCRMIPNFRSAIPGSMCLFACQSPRPFVCTGWTAPWLSPRQPGVATRGEEGRRGEGGKGRGRGGRRGGRGEEGRKGGKEKGRGGEGGGEGGGRGRKGGKGKGREGEGGGEREKEAKCPSSTLAATVYQSVPQLLGISTSKQSYLICGFFNFNHNRLSLTMKASTSMQDRYPLSSRLLPCWCLSHHRPLQAAGI